MAFDVLRNNKVFQDHFHLNNYSLQEMRKKTFDKMVVTYNKSPYLEEVKKFNY